MAFVDSVSYEMKCSCLLIPKIHSYPENRPLRTEKEGISQFINHQRRRIYFFYITKSYFSLAIPQNILIMSKPNFWRYMELNLEKFKDKNSFLYHLELIHSLPGVLLQEDQYKTIGRQNITQKKLETLSTNLFLSLRRTSV